MQYPFSEGNILRQLKDGDILHLDLDGLDFLGKDRKKVPNLVKSIMNFIKGFYIPDYPYPKELDEYWEVLETQLEQHSGSAASCVSAESKVWDSVLNMPESELLKKYYEGLLRQSRYKIRYAATKAGMKETTFRSRLDKYKVSYKKSD
jgi:DNA-binding NtrC family response regulator